MKVDINKLKSMSFEFETTNQIKEALNSVCIADYSETLERIKNDHLKAMIKRFNIWNIEKHPLSDQNNYNQDEISYNGLLYQNVYNFMNTTNKIKAVFKNYTAEDRIKELMPSLSWERVFKSYIKDKKYFFLYDFKKVVTVKEIKTQIASLKKVPVNIYYHENTAINLTELFQLLYGIELDLVSDYRNVPISKNRYNYEYVLEGTLNGEEITIEKFSDHLKITLKDKSNQDDFKNRMVKQMIKRAQVD